MFPTHHFYSSFGVLEFVLNIVSSVANPNIRQLAIDAGWNTTSKVKVNITAPLINTINLPAGTSFPGGLEIVISANTRVGGTANGGSAFITRIPVSIRNLGIMSGGGGGGGQGQTCIVYYNQNGVAAGYGGVGGLGQGFSSSTSLSIVGPYSGESGSYQQYSGPIYGGERSPWAQGGPGGSGGSWGSSGGHGGSGSIGGSYGPSPPYFYDPTPGDGAGRYIDGNSYVTWLATGTRHGLAA